MLEANLATRLLTLTEEVYPLRAPSDFVAPVIIYNRLYTSPDSDLESEGDTYGATFQVDVYDITYLDAKTLAETVRKSLATWNEGVVAQWRDSADMIDETTPTTLYRVRMTYELWTESD